MNEHKDDPCNSIEVRKLQTIQPFGAILALDKASCVVTHASENIQGVLKVSPDNLLGKNLNDIKDSWTQVLNQLIKERDKNRLSLQKPIEWEGKIELILHENETHFIFEWIHFASDYNTSKAFDAISSIATQFSIYRSMSSLEEYADYCSKKIRAILGFDRILILEFLKDGTGEVIAEDKADFMDSFANLRFPASDVPPQVRELYLSNPLRMIINSKAQDLAIIAAEGAQVIDMLYLRCKGVVDIHRTYTQNMGIATSISFGLQDSKKLWGLICFHHKEPKDLPYLTRMVLFLLSYNFEAAINYFNEQKYAKAEIKREELLSKITELLSEGNKELKEMLSEAKELLLEALFVNGFTTHISNNLTSYGAAPEEALVKKIIAKVKEQFGVKRVFATHTLRSLVDDPKLDQKQFAGILALQISPNPEDVLIFYRPESSSTIKWAGNPKETQEVKEKGTLNPRASFNSYQEEVSGVSLEWDNAALLIAKELGIQIRRYALKVLYEQHKITEEQIYQITLATSRIDSGMFILSADQKIIWSNEWFSHFFSFDPNNHEKNLFALLKEHHSDSTDEHPLEGSKDWAQEITLGENEENKKILQIKILPFEIKSTKEQRFAGVITDITQIKKNEIELRELNKQKDEFIKMASHDLRNPLNIILASASQIPEKRENPNESNKLVDTITKQGESLMDILNQLLNVTVMQSGQFIIQYHKIRFKDYFDDNFHFNEIFAHKKKIKLNKEFSFEIEEGAIDKNKVKQIIDNLISNAIKYSNRETEVLLKVVGTKDRLTISITDHGLGIPPEEHDKVFQPSQKVSTKPTGGETSNGLGLVICKKMVEAMEGEIGFESVPGKGSTFFFSIPIKQEESPKSEDKKAKDFDLSKAKPLKKLLIIDDDNDLVNLEKESLKKLQGLEVEIATTKEEALSKITSFAPELILLDYTLPGITGIEMLQEFKKNETTKHISVIFVTGKVDPETREKMAQSGALGVIEKPFNVQNFPKQVMQLWSQKNE